MPPVVAGLCHTSQLLSRIEGSHGDKPSFFPPRVSGAANFVWRKSSFFQKPKISLVADFTTLRVWTIARDAVLSSYFCFKSSTQINWHDLAFFDPTLYESLRQLLLDAEAEGGTFLHDLELNFVVDLQNEEGGRQVSTMDHWRCGRHFWLGICTSS